MEDYIRFNFSNESKIVLFDRAEFDGIIVYFDYFVNLIDMLFGDSGFHSKRAFKDIHIKIMSFFISTVDLIIESANFYSLTSDIIILFAKVKCMSLSNFNYLLHQNVNLFWNQKTLKLIYKNQTSCPSHAVISLRSTSLSVNFEAFETELNDKLKQKEKQHNSSRQEKENKILLSEAPTNIFSSQKLKQEEHEKWTNLSSDVQLLHSHEKWSDSSAVDSQLEIFILLNNNK